MFKANSPTLEGGDTLLAKKEAVGLENITGTSFKTETAVQRD